MGGLCAGQQLHSIPAQMLMFTMAMPRATRFFATMAKSWDAVLPVASPERARSCSAGDKRGAMAAHGENTAGCWMASWTMGCAQKLQRKNTDSGASEKKSRRDWVAT